MVNLLSIDRQSVSVETQTRLMIMYCEWCPPHSALNRRKTATLIWLCGANNCRPMRICTGWLKRNHTMRKPLMSSRRRRRRGSGWRWYWCWSDGNYLPVVGSAHSTLSRRFARFNRQSCEPFQLLLSSLGENKPQMVATGLWPQAQRL